MVQERLRDQIAKALRAALASGELEPGALYSAPVLAARYGVSATPVREAMLDLVREGLVEPVRNKGFRVTEPSGRDLAEFAEVRALVEVPTAGLVARTATPAQLGALRPPAEEAVAAAERGDAAGCREASRRFHAALLGLSGNRRLVEVAADLGRRSSPPGAPGPEDLAAAARDHLDLLDLLAAGDAAGAERCMRRHLDRLRGAGLPAPRRGRPAGRSGTPGVQNVSRQLSM
ncbi:GntR family transcriptional regulator [Streptacidiphilus sp. ASG 303]|uniref:GntR family transcriptional regulator n=1 Tax=Streptacidiphilus sp. ASG 303 TaxID=2896847 RepID=UPI001E52BB9B|nr:GntR family transcriptional regulator [Streptacidiphilus sp. ASG 303]MCD0481317.1 GntR family transcriptional regulator [Streptacidiphilus sp. ASG 303]